MSIIVPIYDVEPYLEACLESLVAQTWADIEVVMVDDGSPDSSAEIAETFAARDARFRLIRQENGGLGTARNTGVRHATGEFLAFVDSDDMLPLTAVETMVCSLTDSGSDLATGNVLRFSGQGVRQSPMHRTIFTGPARRTHVTGAQALLRDRLVTNKLWRRSFWDEHGMSFPEGVLWEDIAVSLPAHFLARAVDVLTTPVYLWREREGESVSITQNRGHVKGIEDRFAAVGSVREFLAGTGRTAHLAAWDRMVLDGDLPNFLQVFDRAGEAFQNRFLDLACAYLEQAGPKVLSLIPAQRRVKWALVRERRLEDLVQVLEWDRTVKPTARVVGGGVRGYHLNSPVQVGRSLTRMRDELDLRQRVDALDWKGDALVVEGRVSVRYLRTRRRMQQHVFAWLVPEGPGRRMRLPVTVRRSLSLVDTGPRRRKDWCGFRLSIDPDRLPAGSTWRIELRVLSRGLLRQGALAQPSPAARRLEFSERDSGTVAWTEWTAGEEFRLRVERPGGRVTGHRVAEGTLRITGRCGAGLGAGSATGSAGSGTAPVLRLTRPQGGRERRYPMTVTGDDFEAVIALDDVLSERWPDLDPASLEMSALHPGAEWHFDVVPAEGPARPLIVGAAVERGLYRLRGRDVVLDRSQRGGFVLREQRPTFYVERVEWDEHGHLRLTGAPMRPIDGPAWLVVTSRNRFTERLFPLVDGTVTVTPEGSDTLAGRLPLPAGTHGFSVRTGLGDMRVEFRPSAPLEHISATRTFTFETDVMSEAVFTVGDDLRASGRPKQQRLLREDFYPARRAEPLRPAVLFDSFGGRQFSDSPRAIYEELRGRGADLEFMWLVRDGQVEVPEGVVPVRRYGREFYDALARCRYVVTNSDLPAWFERRPGQTVVQTWRGTPLKRVGFDVEKVPFARPDHHERLARTVAQWSHLISPGPWCSSILDSALRFQGEILEIGSPRDDLLIRGGAEAVAERAARVRARLGLPEGRKVVLYTPTWRDDKFYSRGRYRLDLHLDLQRMADELGGEYVFLLRKHPTVTDRVPRTGTDLVRDVSVYPDVQELYLVADMLVTDYSSAMFDFAVTGRPLLFYTYDLERYRDEVRGFYFDFEAEAPGPLLRTTDELIAAVRDAGDTHVEYRRAYEAFTARFCPLEDGHAAARAVDRLFA
ncbi:bifunctional glycosyltransferase family 2 protein/CDP-glycerol:glycerophosphate glycerophosphotransferase [Streptosporangium sp. NPDC023615]|uniref:bifunctional glycosyltransferase/CDP-glycerol:glycerophosphate glycerophosphotransferase n=1 Tax=Streptosporangium sp. NPDC023615 TaxID=3154794 RepID=UPI00344766EB